MKHMRFLKIVKQTVGLVTLAVVSLGLVAVFTAPTTYAASKDDICQGIASATTTGSCTDPEGPSVESTLSLVINILSIIIGIVSVLMIMFGGFRYITSAGDSNGISSAKNTIIYAIVGLIIAFFAQVIVQFVLNKATESPEPETSMLMLDNTAITVI